MSNNRFKKSESSNDPLVIYKDNFSGVYYTTPKSNYDARIQNANRIQKWDGFDTPQEIIDYCTKYSSGFDPQNVIIVEAKSSEARGSAIDKQTIRDWVEQINSEQNIGLAATDARLGGKETQYEDDADYKQFDCIKFTSKVFPLTFVEVYSITPDSCSVHVYDGRTNNEVGKATLTDSSDLRTAVVASIKQIYDTVHNQRLVDKAMKLQESLNKGTSMKTESIDDLKDRSVSHGTLRSIDLIPEFLGVLQQYAKDRYDEYVKANPEVLDLEGMDDETLSYVVDELIDELNAVAPVGTYFGSHPGDGSDFGFWTMDESNKKEAKKSEADGDKDVYTIDLYRIDADGDETALDDMEASQTFYSEDDAIECANKLADSYASDDDVVFAVVMGGEREKPNGDIVGEPFDIYWASSSDKQKTADYRKKARYAAFDNKMDYYAKQSEGKQKEAYEDIWRGADVYTYQEACENLDIPADVEKEIIDEYGEDYSDNPDAMDALMQKLDDFIALGFEQDFVYIDGEEIPLAVFREPKMLVVQTMDHKGGDKAVELVKKLANGELTGNSEDGDFVAIMDGVNGSPHFDIYSEGGKSEGKDDKDKKDDKSCKGKDCKDGKQTENREKPQEGPGAGYTVTIKGLTISDEPKISKDGDRFIVEAPVEYEADAEGYDWGSAYIMNELVGTDEGTFPHNPFKGVLTMEVKDSPDIWDVMNDKFFDDVENPTDEEKISILKDRFYKGASFNDFEQNYGGGYSHSKFVSEDDVCMQADWDGFNDIEFGGAADGYASGTLTIDNRFIEDIEFASDYGYNRYKLVEAIQQFVKGRGLEMDWSEDTLYDFVAPYVTSDEITDDFVKEILSEMVDSGVEFTDADGNPADLQLESIQGESKKSEVVSDTDPDDMKVGKFSATLLADDNEYVGSVPGFYDDEGSAENAAKDYLKKNGSVIKSVGPAPTKISIWTVVKDDYGSNLPKDVKVVNITADESKKSESLTLKQKELKDMVRYGKAEDITTLPDEEAKELRKKGIETVGVSRGTYGMNGALLRDKDGNLYAITARSTNLFYFV